MANEVEGAINFLIFSVFFWGLTNYLMLSIVFSDPGYIPRAPVALASQHQYLVISQGLGLSALKYCVTCSVIRPHGATHCT